MQVLFFLRRIGPYHHARFQAAAQKVELVAIETRPASNEYPWHFTANGSYKKVGFNIAENPEEGLRGRKLRNEILKVLDVHSPSVIVTTGWADPEYHGIAIEARKRNIPLAVISDSRQEDETRKSWKELAKKLILKSYSSALVAGSASRRYMETLGFNPDHIFQPWDVVDNQYFYSISQDYPYTERSFICVARFIEKKNLLKLLEVFALYRKNGGTRDLILLGSGEQENEIRQKIKTNFADSCVFLPGFVQYEALPAYLQKAHCLILPSTSDQWGLVVNEALASGVPVVVSRQCGCAEDLINHGINGFIFEAGDTVELLAVMERMDNVDKNKWKKMSDAGRKSVGGWDVSDFAEGLHRACFHAVKFPSKSGFSAIHKLLSR